jgi:L-fuconolactonase
MIDAHHHVILSAFGPERIMAGSGWPVCLLAADYAVVIDLSEAGGETWR